MTNQSVEKEKTSAASQSLSKTILTNKGVSVKIDSEDYNRLSKYSWYINDSGYAMTTIYDPKTQLSNLKIRMHRLIMNSKKGELVDHRNNNRLDNRKSNLRVCNLQTSARNVKRHKDNQNPYKGIQKVGNKWYTRICLNRKAYQTGPFKTSHQAALAYDLWAIDLHKEFANLNFERAL
ncbi:MAG TPA: HNH endonuclease [Patescibacteria group bacterium]